MAYAGATVDRPCSLKHTSCVSNGDLSFVHKIVVFYLRFLYSMFKTKNYSNNRKVAQAVNASFHSPLNPLFYLSSFQTNLRKTPMPSGSGVFCVWAFFYGNTKKFEGMGGIEGKIPERKGIEMHILDVFLDELYKCVFHVDTF